MPTFCVSRCNWKLCLRLLRLLGWKEAAKTCVSYLWKCSCLHVVACRQGLAGLILQVFLCIQVSLDHPPVLLPVLYIFYHVDIFHHNWCPHRLCKLQVRSNEWCVDFEKHPAINVGEASPDKTIKAICFSYFFTNVLFWMIAPSQTPHWGLSPQTRAQFRNHRSYSDECTWCFHIFPTLWCDICPGGS